MRFEEWFNPHNPAHMKAYEFLTMRGTWPKDFVPGHVEVGYLAIPEIQCKMATAWLSAMKHGKIEGSTPFDDI
jgi:hypothetical protein